MALKTLTEDQVVVIRDTPQMSTARDHDSGGPKGVDRGSDADPGSDADSSDHGRDADSSDRGADADSSDRGTDADTGDRSADTDSSDRGISDHSADSDSTDSDRGESGSTTTPRAPDSSDRGPSQPR